MKVPPGIKDGQRIRIKDGSQIYLIPVLLHGDGVHTLEQDGTLRREITCTESGIRNGGQIQVITPYGPISLNISPNTPYGSYWTVKEWGYPRGPRVPTRGDLIITVKSAEAASKNNANTGTKCSDKPIGQENSIARSVLEAILSAALLLAFLYSLPIFVYPMGHALFDGDPGLAVDIAKWNLTRFPPSQGPTIRCVRDAVHTPQAVALKQRTISTGRELEAQHGYKMTDGTSVAIVHSLGGNAGGIVHSYGMEKCIQIALGSHDLDNTIRHEWAHVVAGILTENAAHGPEWQKIAVSFGADTKAYSHCETGDHGCQPRY